MSLTRNKLKGRRMKNQNNKNNVSSQNVKANLVNIHVDSKTANEASDIQQKRQETTLKGTKILGVDSLVTFPQELKNVTSFSDEYKKRLAVLKVDETSLEARIAYEVKRRLQVYGSFVGWKFVHDVCNLIEAFHAHSKRGGSKSFCPIDKGKIEIDGHILYTLVMNDIQWKKNTFDERRKLDGEKQSPEVSNTEK